jgi:poly-gamma-glutamate capsule biosynthesis protein CapA/YwtB (metallophosphatase superfamily)
MPLALVVHASRTPADVPLAAARAASEGRGSQWSDVGQNGGRMRVLTTRDGTAAAVLAQVRTRTDTLAVVPADSVDATVRVLSVAGRHPLREPGAYPLVVRSTRPVPEVTTLSAVGDVMMARRVGARLRAVGDYTYAMRPMAGRLAAAEITLGTFESTLSRNGSPTQGSDSFGADRQVTRALDLAGFDLVSVANNHVGDYGQLALRQTLDRFASARIPTVGAGRNLTEARRPVIVERDGVRIGFLGTDSIGETPAATADRAGTNRLNMPPRTGPLDRAALRRISADITALKRSVDTVIVVTHWGTQYTHEPEQSQRVAARAFAAAGADLVIGGHPHWVQGWEKFGSTPVVHSLGNFIFDMDFQTKTREGIVLDVVLWGGRVKALEPVPFVIDDQFRPRVVTGARAEGILGDIWRTSRGPWREP